MDSTYFNCWLRQAQQEYSLRASSDDSSRGAFGPPTPRTPVWSPNSSSQPDAQLRSDEPLDLRVKPVEPVDDSIPLDLTVTRPHSTKASTGG